MSTITSMAKARRSLTITDPRAIRALVHEVRWQLLHELEDGKVLTATEAARIAGITPSAMSYHLRAMEKWGIVERVESTDGRERPWRAAADDITISPDAMQETGTSTGRQFLGSFLASMNQTANRWSGTSTVGATKNSAQMTQTQLWLTNDEARALSKSLEELIDPYRSRDLNSHPDEASVRDIFWLNLPKPPSS